MIDYEIYQFVLKTVKQMSSSGTTTILVGNRIISDGVETNVIFKSKSFIFDDNGFPIKIRAVIQNLDENVEQTIECSIIYNGNYVDSVSDWTVV